MKTILSILLQTSQVRGGLNDIISDIILPVAGFLVLVTVIATAIGALVKANKEQGNFKDAFFDLGKMAALVIVVIIVIAALASLISTKLVNGSGITL